MEPEAKAPTSAAPLSPSSNPQPSKLQLETTPDPKAHSINLLKALKEATKSSSKVLQGKHMFSLISSRKEIEAKIQQMQNRLNRIVSERQLEEKAKQLGTIQDQKISKVRQIHSDYKEDVLGKKELIRLDQLSQREKIRENKKDLGKNVQMARKAIERQNKLKRDLIKKEEENNQKTINELRGEAASAIKNRAANRRSQTKSSISIREKSKEAYLEELERQYTLRLERERSSKSNAEQILKELEEQEENVLSGLRSSYNFKAKKFSEARASTPGSS